jgi:hypothetical protein
MPEDMADDAWGDNDPGAGECLPHDGLGRRTGQGPKRGPTAEKDMPTRARRASASDVGHERLTDILREG